MAASQGTVVIHRLDREVVRDNPLKDPTERARYGHTAIAYRHDVSVPPLAEALAT